MQLQAFRIKNFRRLKDVRVDLEPDKTIFVGANNSGKTSATQVFQLFLGPNKGKFQIYDFTADCWGQFNAFDLDDSDPDQKLPAIYLDLWFHVDDDNLHRVVDLLPGLDWSGEAIGVRLAYAPRDGKKLVQNYKEALAAAVLPEGHEDTDYQPWPTDFVDYLSKRLEREYEIKYFVLDAKRCPNDFMPEEGYEPFYLGAATSGAGGIVDSLIRVDFLNAQRHLSDTDTAGGRSEDLSKRLGRFYERNLQKLEDDITAMGAIAQSETRLNAHFADVFQETLDSIGKLGYPGIANLGLVIKATFNAHSILSANARVHYALPNASDGTAISTTLPDQYNGLGFKNLIYMVVEILDFHEAWASSEDDRPPVHLIMVEEPEAHLHAQLQQVFIRKVIELLPTDSAAFKTQVVVTTHSSHILYESDFKPVRYFCRSKQAGAVHTSDIKNLSTFYHKEEKPTREFLQQYLKLTHCDLFFADAAILVEGNVERLLLPLIIQEDVKDLRACHLTVLEVGGAFAHKFKNLIEFLELTTLIVTDLDSVSPTTASETSDGAEEDEDDADDEKSAKAKACLASIEGAVTSNETLKQWLPQKDLVADLLAASSEDKLAPSADGEPPFVRVAYQTPTAVEWNNQDALLTGRTLEEAFALQNLSLTQDRAHKDLGLRIPKAYTLGPAELHERLFTRVKGFDKTKFALALMADPNLSWQAPSYIVEGLEWLQARLVEESQPPAPGATPEVQS